MNTTRMHFRTHVRAERRSPPGLTALTEYADGIVEHDATVGELLKKLDDLGIANNTIVIYTTDNGPHLNAWPDAAMTPVPLRERRLPRALHDPLAISCMSAATPGRRRFGSRAGSGQHATSRSGRSR